MEPFHLEGMNVCLAPPRTMPDGETCEPLMAFQTDTGYVSVWKLSDEDLDNILATGMIIVNVCGPHPPLVPFTAKELPPEVPK